MATQHNIIGLRGTIGGLTFSRNGTVSAAPRRPTGPASPLQAANRAEFRTAARTGKLVRDALRRLRGRTKTKGLSARLAARVRELLVLDTTNPLGERWLLPQFASQLTGFAFNAGAALPAALPAALRAARVNANIDISGKLITLTVPELAAVADLRPPPAATHFDLFADLVYVDFPALFTGARVGGFQQAIYSDPAPKQLGGTYHNLTITGTFIQAPQPGQVLLVALGVEFLQALNGQFYKLYHGRSATPYEIIYTELS
ncbi:MAG: hypothetical protein H7330_00240 [Hymenobacteraceae bacterium]|nr:hypothetical protein [Hymenobacteraceae bacterium]